MIVGVSCVAGWLDTTAGAILAAIGGALAVWLGMIFLHDDAEWKKQTERLLPFNGMRSTRRSVRIANGATTVAFGLALVGLAVAALLTR